MSFAPYGSGRRPVHWQAVLWPLYRSFGSGPARELQELSQKLLELQGLFATRGRFAAPHINDTARSEN
jgi:hypothetical protein